MDNPIISFELSEICPLCGNMHSAKYSYKGVPILLCQQAEENKIYGFNITKKGVINMATKKKAAAKAKPKAKKAVKKSR